MKSPLIFAAISEAATGLALLIISRFWVERPRPSLDGSAALTKAGFVSRLAALISGLCLFRAPGTSAAGSGTSCARLGKALCRCFGSQMAQRGSAADRLGAGQLRTARTSTMRRIGRAQDRRVSKRDCALLGDSILTIWIFRNRRGFGGGPIIAMKSNLIATRRRWTAAQ